jgi:hypothetical protein
MRHTPRWIPAVVIAVAVVAHGTHARAIDLIAGIHAFFENGDVRREERRAEEDAMQAQLEARRAERQAEHEACRLRAEQEARAQIDQSLHAKVGMGLTQRIRLGQPQVDMTKLKTLMAQIEKDNEMMQKLHAQLEEERKQEYIQKLQAHLRDVRRAEEAGCECKLPCPPPSLPAQLPPPIERAMLPTEIPINIPATLEVVFERAEMEEARIQRLPAKMPCEEECHHCRHGRCACGQCSQSGGASRTQFCPDGRCPVPPRTTQPQARRGIYRPEPGYLR